MAMKNNQTIPKIIWQTYKTKELPVKGQLAAETWKSLNPGWEYRLWDDDQITRFINDNFGSDLAAVFNSVPLGVMKADIWRYAVLLKYGGVYADIDVTCVVPLDWWEMTWEHLRIALEDQMHFCQWTMAAVPGHRAFEKVLQLIVARALPGIDINYEHFVHWHTGPAVWTAGICAELGLPLTKSSAIFQNHRREATAHRIQILPAGTFNGSLVSHAFGSKYYSKYDYVRWLDERDRIKKQALTPKPGTGACNDTEANDSSKQPGRYLVNASNARDLCFKHLETVPSGPPPAGGKRAILFCVSDFSSFAGAWVAICTLRRNGCFLPIEIWHESRRVMDALLQSSVESFGVRCVDVTDRCREHSFRSPEGIDLRAYAALFCDYEEILLLHEEFLPVINPQAIFNDERFLASGAVFWAESSPLTANNPIWSTLDLQQGKELGFEKGAMLINRAKCWKALHAALLLNECADFFNRFINGYNDAFYLSFLLLRQPFAMPVQNPEPVEAGVCLADFEGKLLFQQRRAKWKVFDDNRSFPGFPHEAQCLTFLIALKTILYWQWGRHRGNLEPESPRESEAMLNLLTSSFNFHRKGYDHRLMTFLPDGTIGLGASGDQIFWKLSRTPNDVRLKFSSYSGPTSSLTWQPEGRWEGTTTIMSNEVQVELVPILPPQIDPQTE